MRYLPFLICLLMYASVQPKLSAAERIVLSPTNWDEFVPSGKEVDAIYGDIVLRNDKVVAVIANPIATRNANMTVRNVAGAVIDLTSRNPSNDQLSAFYPTAAAYALTEQSEEDRQPLRARTVSYRCTAAATDGQPKVTVIYRLRDGDHFVSVVTRYHNPHTETIRVELMDSMRADRSFQFGFDQPTGMFWAYDSWWKQAYGIIPDGREIKPVGDTVQKLRPVVAFEKDGSTAVAIKPNETFTLTRRLLVANHQLQLFDRARRMKKIPGEPCRIIVRDLTGPIADAYVTVQANDKSYAAGSTNQRGELRCSLPKGEYQVNVRSPGRKSASGSLDTSDKPTLRIDLSLPAFINVTVTDDRSRPIPCKLEFKGKNGTPDPYYGPDTFEFGVQNLRYSHNGSFRIPIVPGEYDVIISHGPEYDAVFRSIKVNPDEEFELTARLKHSVDTTGWVSSDFHSHSTPSGDNTSSQLGRVLNLLAEHIEFAPCTEHNRVSTYTGHLRRLDAQSLMATCSGMELTGSPLPVNHQNAFPLKRKPRTQDGGGPTTDVDPIVQIERLALWDNGSDKLVQENHPNLEQIFGDRDTDGKPDGGFRKMFGFMDVVEVHPPEMILSGPKDEQGNWKNTMFRWMQLLNLGYRIPGVVNTDAHYNYHGSGWLRNYIRSQTDDPARIDTMDIVHASERGNIIMTNGPFMEVSATKGSTTAIPGEDISAGDGSVALRVKVQCPNWLEINRVQVFVNGRPVPDLNFTRAKHGDLFHTGTVKFDHQIMVRTPIDAHLIVAAAGEGLTLGPVYGDSRGATMPIAVSNPIFVDVDGGGFRPNGDLLDAPLVGK